MPYVQYSLNYPAADLGDAFGATAGRPNPHRGQDVAPDGGGSVYAIADGTLVWDWYSAGLGNVAVIAHADGKFSGYCHMAHESPLTIGSPVARNQAIGEIGATGSLQNGRHLHFTVATSMAGAAGGFNVIDPMTWIAAHSATASVLASSAGTPLGVSPAAMFTSTQYDGEPGPIYWTKVQSELAARGWYTNNGVPCTIDGKPGPVTHHGHARLQAAILNERRGNLPRTTTEEDGIPGPVFWTLAQTIGRAYGYAWGIDGIPGPNTEEALYKLTAEWLNKYGR